jgi:hypothetical protein
MYIWVGLVCTCATTAQTHLPSVADVLCHMAVGVHDKQAALKL